MAESLRGGLSLGLCGFGFWSHDIGGFEGTPPATVYKRWIAFGLLSSHSRLHGSSSYRVPWLFDDEAVDVLRLFTKLKCRLMPYLFAMACEARDSGVPMMRAMMLEFPGDPACDTLDRQYMLGDSLLVAPVFSEDGAVDYYLPAGRWTHLLTGEVKSGPAWFRESHDALSLPLYVRQGAVIGLGAHDSRPDYDYCEGVTFRVYGLVSDVQVRASVPDPTLATGLTLVATQTGEEIKLRVEGATTGWQALLVNRRDVGSVTGGTAIPETQGTRIASAAGASSVIVTLAQPS